MALCSYRGATFEIAGGETVPLPTRPEAGFPTLDLPVIFRTQAAYEAMQRSISRVTQEVALGSFAGYVIVHAGPGAHVLAVPTDFGGGLQNYDAVLTRLAVSKLQNDGEGFFARGDVTFVVISSLVP